MDRHTLKDGTTIMVRTREEVPQRHRRAIQAISIGLKEFLNSVPDGANMVDIPMTEEQADAMIRLQEVTVVGLLASWSRPEPITKDTVADLPGPLFDEVAEITRKVGADIALDVTPTLEVTDAPFLAAEDAAVGTGGSAGG